MNNNVKLEFRWVGSYNFGESAISSINCDALRLSADIDKNQRSDREQSLTLNFKDNESFKKVQVISPSIHEVQEMKLYAKVFEQYNDIKGGEQSLRERHISIEMEPCIFKSENRYRITIIHQKNILKATIEKNPTYHCDLFSFEESDVKINVLKGMSVEEIGCNHKKAKDELLEIEEKICSACKQKNVDVYQLQILSTKKNECTRQIEALEKEIEKRNKKCTVF